MLSTFLRYVISLNVIQKPLNPFVTRDKTFILDFLSSLIKQLTLNGCEYYVTKSYHCNICGRAIIATSVREAVQKVPLHNRINHGISEYTSTQLLALRREIEHPKNFNSHKQSF
jgi:hypothetical protein